MHLRFFHQTAPVRDFLCRFSFFGVFSWSCWKKCTVTSAVYHRLQVKNQRCIIHQGMLTRGCIIHHHAALKINLKLGDVLYTAESIIRSLIRNVLKATISCLLINMCSYCLFFLRIVALRAVAVWQWTPCCIIHRGVVFS